eukprot:TRINITY_DN12615_c0_g1_i1.p1 TRINITY_DN12615_c0_g1~~TRINITY_DN12615_c0_g1_i1.p1  ORF type:complete len:608 (+),score=172.41 TRINITY_DN12615_c0_g1_i1:65-1825(+)
MPGFATPRTRGGAEKLKVEVGRAVEVNSELGKYRTYPIRVRQDGRQISVVYPRFRDLRHALNVASTSEPRLPSVSTFISSELRQDVLETRINQALGMPIARSVPALRTCLGLNEAFVRQAALRLLASVHAQRIATEECYARLSAFTTWRRWASLRACIGRVRMASLSRASQPPTQRSVAPSLPDFKRLDTSLSAEAGRTRAGAVHEPSLAPSTRQGSELDLSPAASIEIQIMSLIDDLQTRSVRAMEMDELLRTEAQGAAGKALSDVLGSIQQTEAKSRAALLQCEELHRETAARLERELLRKEKQREAEAAHRLRAETLAERTERERAAAEKRAVTAELRYNAMVWAPPGHVVTEHFVLQRIGQTQRLSVGGNLSFARSPPSHGRPAWGESPLNSPRSLTPSNGRRMPPRCLSGPEEPQSVRSSPSPKDKGLAGASVDSFEVREDAAYFSVDVLPTRRHHGWRVWRRYSHFASLRDEITAVGHVSHVVFPGKGFVRSERQLEGRRQGLDAWLRAVIAVAQTNDAVGAVIWRFVATSLSTGNADSDLMKLSRDDCSTDFLTMHAQVDPTQCFWSDGSTSDGSGDLP